MAEIFSKETFQKAPEFKTPEEELSFLRERLKEREAELKEKGKEVSREELAKEAVKAYAKVEAEKVLPAERIIAPEETHKIVLELSPEPHDKKIEELFGILMHKGLKNALSVLEKFESPHLDDDFHRFLVQYLHSTGSLPDLKEKTPLFKALNMKLFEVTLPQAGGEEKKGFKEFLGAMEQFYAGMQSVGEAGNWSKNYFTLEAALPGSGTQVVIYAAVSNAKAELFEKQLLAFYHEAKIKEVTDDYNIFNAEGDSAGAYAKFTETKVFPIKTYDTLEHDPMKAILNVFSKLKAVGEGASIQFVITPAGDKFVKKFSQVLDKVKEGKTAKEALKLFGEFDERFAKAVKDLVFGHKKEGEKDKEPKKVDDKAVEQITKKIGSTIADVTIRVISSAETPQRAEEILSNIEAAFNQFNEPGGNGFKFEKVSERKLPDLLHEFSYRLPNEDENLPLNFKELSTVFHFPAGVESVPELKEAKAGMAPAPADLPTEGVLLGYNEFRGVKKEIRMAPNDRLRHFYVIGQTGTGKTTILKNMIAQDMARGEGCCFIDPHGSDIQDILSYVPKERIDDVIYFDPAATARPMGLNMLEYDIARPQQKTFVVNELLSIFKQLYGGTPESMGPAFEQYFRNSARLVMEHPESGNTLLEIARVLQDEEFRKLKLSYCKDPIIKQFWVSAEKVTGEAGLQNWAPYITNKFDTFLTNDIMRPIVLQEKSVFDFRKIMDEKKILLVNLSKGILGEINANLLGLIIVGKIQMAALSRADSYGIKLPNFYLYIDEFQNVTTDSIASILSEARKYGLSLNMANQYLAQLKENIRDAVFGNVGSTAVYRVSPEDAEFLEKKYAPTFTARDITKLDNFNSYVNMLSGGVPAKPFSMTSHYDLLPKGNKDMVSHLKELSAIKYGRDRAEVEEEINSKYKAYEL